MATTPTVHDVERFLDERLAAPLPGPRAQQRFAPSPWLADWSPELTPDTARRAAVLILLYPGGDETCLSLTVRHARLPHHAGQISLPGGGLDPGESADAAALREAEEEIGIPRDRIRLLGPLSTLWVAVSNFVVHPFVGVAYQPPEFQVHPDEVEALLAVPLSELRDPARLKWTTAERFGRQVRYPYFDLAGHMVWGATAMVLGEFACLFDPSHGPPAPGQG